MIRCRVRYSLLPRTPKIPNKNFLFLGRRDLPLHPTTTLTTTTATVDHLLESKMSEATSAACASQQDAPTAVQTRSELEEALWGRINLEQIVKMHRDFPKYAEYIEEWTFNQEAWMWQQRDKANLAETLGCSEDELRRTYTEQRRKWFACRAKNIGKNRTEKHDLAYAAALWKIHSVSALHKKLASIEKEKVRLESLEKSIVQRGEHQAMLTERLAMWEAERHGRFQTELEAAVEPTIEKRNKEKQTILDSKIVYHEKQAEWAQAAKAKYDKKTAEYEAAHPTKDATIKKQQRKIEDQQRELTRLQQQVRGYEAAERHRKKRKADAENQRERRRLHAKHPAVPTMTPESTTKKTKPRTSRRSALARIGNNANIV